MTHDELIKRFQNDLRAYSEFITFRYIETPADAYTDSDSAFADASAEVGGAVLPIYDKTQEFWFIQRAKRHLYQVVLNNVALRYQAKAFSAHQQFDHIKLLIDQMDKAWEDARATLIIDSGSAFGQAFGTGLAYDDLGRQI